MKRLAAVAAAAALLLTGCQFDGIDSLALPGGKGTGDDAIKVSVELPDVGTLTANAQVKVDDIAVGTVTAVRVENWHAVADLSLEPDVELPANAVARVGVNTLLGAAFVELDDPARPEGVLADGDTITLERGHAYPSTEQVLSAASLALNGGGLEQLATITTELNRVLGGNDRAVRDLLPRLDSFIGTLDGQRGDILTAVRDLSRLSKRFGDRRDVIASALDELGPALEALAAERPQLTKALTSLDSLSEVATPLVTGIKDDLIADLRGLVPALRGVVAAGEAGIRGVGYGLAFPFAPETVLNACRNDYCNLALAVDLTNASIVNGFTRPDGSLAVPGLPVIPNVGDVIGPILSGLLGQGLSTGIGLLDGLLGGLPPAQQTGQQTGRGGQGGGANGGPRSGSGGSGSTGSGGSGSTSNNPAPGLTGLVNGILSGLLGGGR